MILLDTSGVLVFLDRRAAEHGACRRVVERSSGPFVLSPFVLAEVDYLVSSRLGAGPSLGFIRDVADGAYQVAHVDNSDVGHAREVMSRHADLLVGLADASIVVLAERYGVGDILTFDQRHFRVLTWAGGRPFRLLPADV